MTDKTPEFAIFQNSRTKTSAVWSDGRWVDADAEEYDILALVARLLRTSEAPSEVVEQIKTKPKPDKY